MASNKATRVRITDAGDSIRRREAFVAGDGSLSGGHVYMTTGDGFGGMEDPHRRAFRDAVRDHGARLYVVRSYGTPIAWAGPGEPLTVPDVRYTSTTSRHQGIARRADLCPEPECEGSGFVDYSDTPCPRCNADGSRRQG